MADKIIVAHGEAGLTVYAQVRNSSAQIYNGSTFEAYDALRWTYYDIALTEQGASGVYQGDFPALSSGAYSLVAYSQLAGTPAQTDTLLGGADAQWTGTVILAVGDIVAHGDTYWSTKTDLAVTGALFTNTAARLIVDGSGLVEINNVAAIVTAVWAAGTRTLTSFGTLVADTTTAVWAAGTRTLSSFGSLVASTATAVWAESVRTLSAFGFTVTSTDDAAIKVVTDKVATALEADGGVYRFTANALEMAPDTADATEAKQDTIIAAVAALNDPSAAEIVTALFGTAVDGTLGFQTAMKRIAALASGKVVRTATSPLTLAFYAEDNTTVLFTLAVQTDGSSRARS